MAYSVEADVQNAAGGATKLRQLSDYDGDNAINSSVVTNAIEQADAFINGYAKKRYAIPLSPVPSTIKWLSARLAVWFMARDRAMVSETMSDQHALDMDWLRDLSKGRVVLDMSTDPAASEFVVAKNEARPDSKAVSRETTKGFW